MTTATALPAAPPPAVVVTPVTTTQTASGDTGQAGDEATAEHDFADVLAAIALVVTSMPANPTSAPLVVADAAGGQGGVAAPTATAATAGDTTPRSSTVLAAPTPPLVETGTAPTATPTSVPVVAPETADVTVPATRPAVTVPAVAIPAVAIPGVTVPAGTVPGVTVPDGTRPVADLDVDTASIRLAGGADAPVSEHPAPLTEAPTDTGSETHTGPAAASAFDTGGDRRDPGQRPVPTPVAATQVTAAPITTPEGDQLTAARVVRPVPIDGAARLGSPNSISVDLGDERLGALLVTATTERGAVNLVVNAAEDRTRDAILQQRSELLDDLESAGVRLGTLDINPRNPGDGRDHDQDSGANGGPRDRHGDAAESEPTRRRASSHDNRLDLHL